MFKKGDIVRMVESNRGSGIFHTFEMKVLSMYKECVINNSNEKKSHFLIICEYESKNIVKKRIYHQDLLIYIRSSRKYRIRNFLK